MAHNLYDILHRLKLAMAMVLVQIMLVGGNIFYKLATNDGMNLGIIVAYGFLFATDFMVPLAFFIERKSRSTLTWMVAFQAFLCGLFGRYFAAQEVNECQFCGDQHVHLTSEHHRIYEAASCLVL